PEIYTLSLHDALPISSVITVQVSPGDRPLLVEGEEAMNPVRTVWLLLLVLFLVPGVARAQDPRGAITGTVNDTSGARLPGVTITDRKSTRLNSSHVSI